MTDGSDRRQASGDDDLYATLGVPSGATEEEITRAYRRLAREHHPDANPDAAGGAFTEVADAYDVLRDPERRRAYDDTRGARADAARAAGVRIPIRHATPPRTHAPRAELDEVEVGLTFDQAALGTTAEITVERDAACGSCGGDGRSPGVSSCPECGGVGATVRNSGGITIRTTCARCGGSGRPPAEPCRTCHGTGHTPVTGKVTVRIPAGVDDGDRFRVRLLEDGSDLAVVVRTRPHEFFRRHGDDITLRLPITVAEASLGAIVSVPTLTGAVAMRIPPGTPHGRTFRVRGRGIQRPERAGDLLVTVDVVIPATLNDEQRAALEAFARATESPRARFEHRQA